MSGALHRTGHHIIQLLLVAALVSSLVISSGLSTLTFLIALFGLIAITVARLRGATALAPADREIKLIGFAMSFFGLVSVLSWASNSFQYEDFKSLGTHGRLLLFWPVFVALSIATIRSQAALTALLAASVVAGGSVALTLVNGDPASRASGATNAIAFGNLSLVLGVLSLVAARHAYQTRRYRLIAPALLAVVAALFAAYFSGTRSNFLALPVLILLFALISEQPKERIGFAFVAVAALIALGSMANRFGDTLELLSAGVIDQSIRVRFEIWQESLRLFLQNPFIGAGTSGYEAAVHSAVNEGRLSEAALSCCLGHAHNDLLHALATRGLAGALAYLLLIFIPLSLFLRLVRHESYRVRNLALSGAVIPLAFLVFGLTESAFERGIYTTFYLITVTTIAYLLYQALDAALYRAREQKLSATIITYNEADNIGDCLESLLPVADEIIVVDSGSTDDTVAIAGRYTDRITVTDWPGFGPQKQRALAQASGDWVLSIDADERVTPYLAREINHRLCSQPDADAFCLPWAVTIYGKRLDFGRSARAPLRLFSRPGASFTDASVHETILLPDGARVRTLRGRLTHYTHRNYGHALSKSVQYAWLSARQKAEKGKSTRTLLYPSFRALTTFLQVYILRLGFLDGPVGYLMAVTYAQSSFNTYAGLWTLGREAHRVKEDP